MSLLLQFLKQVTSILIDEQFDVLSKKIFVNSAIDRGKFQFYLFF